MQSKQLLSKQTKSIYSLLLKRGALNAEEIGNALNIFPNAVYRSIDQLQSMGCIKIVGKYPAVFAAQPVSESVETFLLVQKAWFLKVFSESPKQKPGTIESRLKMTFIESRELMFRRLLLDYSNSKFELSLLVSGDELPAEIMLALKGAVDRGIRVREIVQISNNKKASFINARKHIGIHVRYLPPVHVRILIVDRKIVYFMSYNPNSHFESNGIRFEYAPLGQLIHDLFLQYWEKGKEL